MPTAAELRADARRLDDVLAALGPIRADLVADRDDPGVRGGVARVASWAIGAAIDDLDRLGRSTTALVDELHRRAVLCDRYTADLQRYHHDLSRWSTAMTGYRTATGSGRPTEWPGPEPTPPAVPFAGAVAG